jgi:SAM-dependent methyltransferase
MQQVLGQSLNVGMAHITKKVGGARMGERMRTLGFGEETQKGYVVMNDSPGPFVNIVWDFNKFPWPFPNDSIDLIKADGILQKISRENRTFLKFMDECWRVLKVDGQFVIAVPYAGSYEYYKDPTNVNPMNESTWCYFDPLENIAGKYLYHIYKPKPWRIKHLYFKVNADMEVLMEKRREDVSYEEGKV